MNFGVPLVPDDYIHRVGRTARAGATGQAFTFVSPEEESTLKPIERAIGRALPRVTDPDFNYAARPDARLEIPIADRIRQIRARKYPLSTRKRALEDAEDFFMTKGRVHQEAVAIAQRLDAAGSLAPLDILCIDTIYS